MHLAEFNIGRLRHDWDDPRIAPFAEALDRVNAVAQRAPGFVWMLPEDEMSAAQSDPGGPLGGDTRIASSLSVWRNAGSLAAFAFGTIHRQFHARGAAWFGEWSGPRLVLWWVDEGHRPDVEEAADRLRRLAEEGPGEAAFGWEAVPEARRWREAGRGGEE